VDAMKTILLGFLLMLCSSLVPSPNAQPVTNKIPVINGKPLSVWVDQLEFTAIDRGGRGNETGYPAGAKTKDDLEAYLKLMKVARKEAGKAVRDLGMKAVPYLLQRVQTPGSYKERESIPLETSSVFIEISPRVKRGQAVHGLLELVDYSDQIIPQLDLLLKKPEIDPDAQGAVIYAIKEIRRLKEKVPMQK
jgi:hypothetical protein